jgi:O-antigen ligase
VKPLLFTYGLAYGGAAVALFNPYVGLLIYVCFAIIKPESLWFWAVPEGNYSRVIAIALLAGWVLQGTVFAVANSDGRGRAPSGGGSWRFGRGRAIVLAAVGYLAWCAVASLVAPNEGVAWGFTESTAKIILPVVVGATLIDSERKVKQLAWVIVLSEGYLAWEFNLSYLELGPFNRLTTMGFAGMEEKSVAVGVVTAAGVALFLGLDSKRWWARALALALAALMMHVPLFTLTRGGMLGLAVTALVAFLLLPKRPGHYLLFALMVALGLRLAGPEVRKQFWTTFNAEGQRDESAQLRVEHWRCCRETIAEHPLTGIGPRHWPEYWRTHYKRGYRMEAHQTWLQLAAEMGIPGMLLLAAFMGLCVARLWPVTRERTPVPDPELRGIARGVIAGLVGFAVASQFITLYFMEIPFYVALLGVGILKVLARQEAGAESPPGEEAELADAHPEPGPQVA